jgi:uncharacterized protein YbjT (DUF2867 family)
MIAVVGATGNTGRAVVKELDATRARADLRRSQPGQSP